VSKINYGTKAKNLPQATNKFLRMIEYARKGKRLEVKIPAQSQRGIAWQKN
jgi:hypothetical protein